MFLSLSRGRAEGEVESSLFRAVALNPPPPSPLTVSARGYLAISKVVLVFTGRRGGGVSVVAIWHLVDRCR